MTGDRKILIVDDSEEQIVFTGRILEDNGYTYNVARDGNEALAAIQKEKPALVLLDIMMPGKTGLNVLKFMKGEPDLESIPVIVVSGATAVTGVSMKTGEQEAKQSDGDVLARGFGEVMHDKLEDLKPDGMIEKPVNPPVLLERIKELLSGSPRC
jgi:CheY-like chemotaxis protein